MAFPPDFARQVKSSADIVRIVGETVRLKKAGSNYVGLCPFHQEKTPSFSVHPVRQFYYCFGCGAKGDVFRFVMETEKADFPEAVKRVAQRAGIPVPAERLSSAGASPEARLRAALEQVHEHTLGFYRRQLESAEAAPVRQLIRQRGVAADSTEEFGLGFAPGGGSALLRHLSGSFPKETLEASGLFIRRDSGDLVDRFRNRWIFAIASETGKTVAFAGRALGEDQPKYLNSPETPLYSKGHILYNLSRAREAIRRSNSVLLVEGYMDVIAVWQAGVKNVVATCGTALTEWQVRALARLAPEAVAGFDPDSAGQAATDRSLSLLLEEGLHVKVLRLPGAADPDLFIRQQGAEAYRVRMAGAPPFFHYLASRAVEVHGKATAEAKLNCINFLLPFVAKVPSRLIRAELVADISQKLDVGTGIVMEAFRKAGVERKEFVERSPELERIPTSEAMIIRLLLDNEEARRTVPELLQNKDLLSELESRIIVSTLLSMIAAGSGDLDFATLADRLDQKQQRILAQIAFEKDARPVSLDEAAVYVSALERKRLKRQRRSLQTQIVEAQKANDVQLFKKLLEEGHKLDMLLRNAV